MPTVPGGLARTRKAIVRVIVLIKQQTFIIYGIHFYYSKREKRDRTQNENTVQNVIAIRFVYTNLFCYFIGSSALFMCLCSYVGCGRAKIFCAMSHALRIFVSSKNIRVAKCIKNSSVFLAAAQQHTKTRWGEKNGRTSQSNCTGMYRLH